MVQRKKEPFFDKSPRDEKAGLLFAEKEIRQLRILLRTAVTPKVQAGNGRRVNLLVWPARPALQPASTRQNQRFFT